jgi:threonine dehydratase/serine racemase
LSDPTIDDVRAAARRIAGHVHRTPLARSRTFDRMAGAEVVFKCENLQKVGAFKARGAVNAVLQLSADEATRGVVTHSSGNHAAALAYAAGLRGAPCVVVMPDDAPAIKVEAVRGYGAEIVFCPREARKATCERVVAERGLTFIHPFTDPRIIAGQGTAALELVEDAGELDVVVAPIGGGGLLAGTAIAVGSLVPRARVWGAEPAAADDAARSIAAGRIEPAVERPATLADGLMTGIGEINFRVLRERGVRVVTVTEDEIVRAGQLVVERMKLVIEPSAATAPAAVLRSSREVRGLRIGVILSGGNTDLTWMAQAG